MRRRMVIIAGLCLAATAALLAQATSIHGGATLPANCTVGNIYLKTSGGAEGLYLCLSVDTWTAAGGALADDSVTNAKLADMAALTVKARTANSSGDPSDLAAGVNGQTLRRRADALEFAQLVTGAAQASPPASPADGDLHFPTDGTAIRRYNGSAWASWGPISPWTELVDGDFAWVNQGGATVSATNGGILLSAPAAAGDNFRIRAKAAPTAPYVLTVYVDPIYGDQTTASYGIGFRQSSDGKLHLMLLHLGAGGNIMSIKFADATTFSATYAQVTQASVNFRTLPIRWLRVADDATNRIVSYSPNGLTWFTLHTIGRTDFLTADQLVFFLNAADASDAAAVHVQSWKQE